MEKLFMYLAEHNKYFNPNDSLSKLIKQISNDFENELDEEDLFSVHAARGDMYHNPADPRKEKDQT